MIPFDLTRWFRRRMLPLVAFVGVVVFVAAPLAYVLNKRHELWQEARAEATRAALVLHAEIDQRPQLWRYNAPKLLERLAAEGLLGGRLLEIRTSDGEAVPLESVAAPRRPIWGRADVLIGDARAASVWVALDAAPLVSATAGLAAAFAGLALILCAILYLMPMRAIATAQRRIQALLGELALTLQEEDRRRIARDLHDGAGQALTAARLRLLALARGARAQRVEPTAEPTADPSGPSDPSGQSGKRAEPGSPPKTEPKTQIENERSKGEAALADISQLLDEAIEEVRRSVYTLAPPALGELGLGGALQRHCEAFAGATGLSVLCEIEDLPPLRPGVETACYRIVQEALTNTARHANARRAWVQLRVETGTLCLSVYDDGEASPNAAAPREGIGLLGIRERARLLGGNADITVAPDHGLRIEVRLPL
jgi:signal transduction histidine kinase